MYWFGIDVGRSGAISVISDSGEDPIILSFSPENLINVCDTFYGHAVVEKVGAMPGQGVTSMFHFGENFGFIQGVLQAKGIPYQLVPPKTWQKEYGIHSKEESIETAKRLFPQANLKATERSRVDNHNFADSLLMAEWGRRHTL